MNQESAKQLNAMANKCLWSNEKAMVAILVVAGRAEKIKKYGGKP